MEIDKKRSNIKGKDQIQRCSLLGINRKDRITDILLFSPLLSPSTGYKTGRTSCSLKLFGHVYIFSRRHAINFFGTTTLLAWYPVLYSFPITSIVNFSSPNSWCSPLRETSDDIYHRLVMTLLSPLRSMQARQVYHGRSRPRATD